MITGIIYTASLDSSAKLITAGVFVAYIAISLWIIRSLRKSKAGKDLKYFYYGTVMILWGTMIAAYLYSPRNYVIGNFDLTINRPVDRITIQVRDIAEIRELKDDEMEGTIRTFGVGGLFGYYGSFHNQHIGDFKMYATKKTGLVIIHTTQGDTFVISPDDKNLVARIIAKKADI